MSEEKVVNDRGEDERERDETEGICPRCARLQSKVAILADISVMRQSLLDQRGREVKDLIVKLKFFEECIDKERQIREFLTRRVESAEQQCIELTENLRRNVEAYGDMRSTYDKRISGLMSEVEESDTQLQACKQELVQSQQQNEELNQQVSDVQKLLNDSRSVVRKLERRLTVIVERNKVFSCQMSLLNNLFTETDLVLIDFDRIKAIGDIVRETHNLPDLELQGDDGTGRKASIDLENAWEKIDNEIQDDEIPGEESCYKSVDTIKGPQLVLSVSRTFIKLKDLILEKKALQREIDSLKTLNSRLETKVDKQERRLYCVTVELNKTWSLVSKLKVEHNKLHTNEAVLKYELQEKRHQLQKLKTDLSSSREKWLRVRQKNSQSQLEWQKLRDEFSQRKKESSQESAFSENMSSSSANDDEESVPILASEQNEGHTEEEAGAFGITLIPGQEEIAEDYTDPLEDMVSDLVEEIETNAAEGDAEDEGIEEVATSSEESSSERVIRRANRLRILEEQCHLLHSKLLASTARSAALASKLATLHNHYGSRDSDPENSENYEQGETVPTGDASPSTSTADAEATINQTRSDVYDTEMPSSENDSSQYDEIPVIINHLMVDNNESSQSETTVHNAEIVVDVVPVPPVDFVEAVPTSEIVQPIVNSVDVSTDSAPLEDSLQMPNLIITIENPVIVMEDEEESSQFAGGQQVDTDGDAGESVEMLSELDVSREQSHSPLPTVYGISLENEIEESDGDDERDNHVENSSSSEGSFSGSPDPNYLGRLIIKQLPLRLEILKRENQALMKEATEVKLEMKETERILRHQVAKHKRMNEKLKGQLENKNLIEFELREELGHKEQAIEELQKEIQNAKLFSENCRRKEEIIGEYMQKVSEQKLDSECPMVAGKFTKSCHRCSKTFSFFSRKHNCGICGQVFCKLCATKSKSAPASQIRMKAECRICTTCQERRDHINALATQFASVNF